MGRPGDPLVKNPPALQETWIKTISKKKKCEKAKWLSEEVLQIAEKREVKSKGEKERYPEKGNGNPSSIFPGKSREQMNLVGYSPWGPKRPGLI